MTLSFHLGTEYDTIDVATAELGANQLTAIEQEVNRQIYRNARINTSWVTAEEAATVTIGEATYGNGRHSHRRDRGCGV